MTSLRILSDAARNCALALTKYSSAASWSPRPAAAKRAAAMKTRPAQAARKRFILRCMRKLLRKGNAIRPTRAKRRVGVGDGQQGRQNLTEVGRCARASAAKLPVAAF